MESLFFFEHFFHKTLPIKTVEVNDKGHAMLVKYQNVNVTRNNIIPNESFTFSEKTNMLKWMSYEK